MEHPLRMVGHFEAGEAAAAVTIGLPFEDVRLSQDPLPENWEPLHNFAGLRLGEQGEAVLQQPAGGLTRFGQLIPELFGPETDPPVDLVRAALRAVVRFTGYFCAVHGIEDAHDGRSWSNDKGIFTNFLLLHVFRCAQLSMLKRADEVDKKSQTERGWWSWAGNDPHGQRALFVTAVSAAMAMRFVSTGIIALLAKRIASDKIVPREALLKTFSDPGACLMKAVQKAKMLAALSNEARSTFRSHLDRG